MLNTKLSVFSSSLSSKDFKKNNQDKVVEVLLTTEWDLRKDYHVEDFEVGSPDFSIKTDNGNVDQTWEDIKQLLAL